jgi:valine--pyruvate aminotransferase
MNFSLSKIGTQMSQLTGVRAIMKDIIETLHSGNEQEFINLSAGNPLILPEVEQLWRDCTAELLASSEYGEVVCRYGSSQGYDPLIEAIARDFNQRYGLNLTERHILITPGSQSLYFFAANVFGGYTESGDLKKVILPISPEYTGYGGVSLAPESVVSFQPSLDINEEKHRFKYRPNFKQLKINQDTGCVIFSRPSNPTGNILSDQDVKTIANLAAIYDIPVLVDSAYATPFPALNFTPMNPIFGGNIIHCLSLSKAGLPGERLGVAIAEPNLIQVLQSFQTNACIHSSRYGQALAARAISSGKLAHISATIINPFYRRKFDLLEATFDAEMSSNLPWFLHSVEGAIFAWLWLKDLPITDWELYQELKKVGVIVVPGSSFFPGLKDNWKHKQECLRISLTASNDEITTAIKRIAKVVEKVYNSNN